MAKISDFIKWETNATQSQNINGSSLQLESKVLSIQFPGGEYVWNRPTAVYINKGNQTTRIPITDTTRNTLWIISGTTILISILARLKNKRPTVKKEPHYE